jgi:hypothetical protein
MGGVSLCHENGVNGLFINEMWASRQRRRATGRLKAVVGGWGAGWAVGSITGLISPLIAWRPAPLVWLPSRGSEAK